ncbi:MAG: VWA domain-containing protein [Chloroflexota bacterium]
MDEDVRRHAEQLAQRPRCCSGRSAWSARSAAPRARARRAAASGDGELDLEATLDNIVGKAFADPEDIVVERRVEQRRQVVLMVDTSGSMAGENRRSRPWPRRCSRSRCTRATSASSRSTPRPVTSSGSASSRRSAGSCAACWTAPAPGPRTSPRAWRRAFSWRWAGTCAARRVLTTDGQYTVGHDLCKAAARFPSLHVLHTLAAEGTRPGGFWITPLRQVGADVARIGGGRLVPGPLLRGAAAPDARRGRHGAAMSRRALRQDGWSGVRAR